MQNQWQNKSKCSDFSWLLAKGQIIVFKSTDFSYRGPQRQIYHQLSGCPLGFVVSVLQRSFFPGLLPTLNTHEGSLHSVFPHQCGLFEFLLLSAPSPLPPEVSWSTEIRQFKKERVTKHRLILSDWIWVSRNTILLFRKWKMFLSLSAIRWPDSHYSIFTKGKIRLYLIQFSNIYIHILYSQP